MKKMTLFIISLFIAHALPAQLIVTEEPVTLETATGNIYGTLKVPVIDRLEKGETITDVPPALNALFRPSVQPYMISWFKYNPQDEISELTIPVLILQGTTDIQVSLKQAELLADSNKKARKVIIQNMDHVMKNTTTTDQQTQVKESYTNPEKPVMPELIKDIISFIKE